MKITYDHEIIEELDSVILDRLDYLGYRWYAQGFNLETGVRDLCFDPPAVKG